MLCFQKDGSQQASKTATEVVIVDICETNFSWSSSCVLMMKMTSCMRMHDEGGVNFGTIMVVDKQIIICSRGDDRRDRG
jgi:hypothetical protein